MGPVIIMIPAFQHIRGRRQGRAFTLVELLVVIALMAIVLTITIASFQMSGGGAKMQSALLQLKSTVSLARQMAVTRREPMYVVFPESLSMYDPAVPDQRASLAYQAYSVYSPSEGYISQWNTLPKGLYFNRLATGSGTNVFSNSSLTRFMITNTPSTVVFPKSRPRGEMPCISFLPNGRLNQRGGTAIEVFIAEGVVDAVNPDNVLTQANKKVMSLYIRPLTGIMTMKEY